MDRLGVEGGIERLQHELYFRISVPQPSQFKVVSIYVEQANPLRGYADQSQRAQLCTRTAKECDRRIESSAKSCVASGSTISGTYVIHQNLRFLVRPIVAILSDEVGWAQLEAVPAPELHDPETTAPSSRSSILGRRYA
jgi:hypothetical protein